MSSGTPFEELSYMEACYAALFAKLKGAAFAGGITLKRTQRVEDVPDAVPPGDMPALLQVQGGARTNQKEFALGKWTFTAIAVIYVRADAGVVNPNPLPSTVANNIVWGLQQAMAPISGVGQAMAGPYQRQTLGGLVYHAWIEGDVFPEYINEQIVVQLPIYMLAGNWG